MEMNKNKTNLNRTKRSKISFSIKKKQYGFLLSGNIGDSETCVSRLAIYCCRRHCDKNRKNGPTSDLQKVVQ